ncbi:hypothetical protein F6X53_11140 [Methylobacterium soli]|uniref:HTH cro/C1-type domain-containing protein n=1 Tax=Methylobacterium soli TaxID=553447 RepID=A0A6L3SZ78_9HYPH|nr:hypothetical protein F6X53_11140 [Methylobacterium soli]
MIRKPLEGRREEARADVPAFAEKPNALAVIEQQRGHTRVRDPAYTAESVNDGQEMVGGQHGAEGAGNLPHQSRGTSRSLCKNDAGIFPRMATDLRERIQERLKDLSKSMRAASLDGGLGPDAIRDLMRRPNDSPTMETIEKLARGLNTTAAWLAFEAGPKTLRPGGSGLINANRQFTLARVDSAVRAGAFLAAPSFDDDLGEVISAPRDPEYPFARQIAYRVEGDSMNEAKPRPIREGDFIICAAWEDLGIEPRDGQLVVVQQTINDGQLRERSVKAIRLMPDQAEFVPMSSNPRHEPIVVPRNLEPNDGRKVEILALVRYVFDNQLIR